MSMKELFIPAENRPEPRPNQERFPALDPDAPKEVIDKTASDVLTDWRRLSLLEVPSDAGDSIWEIRFSKNPDVVWTVLEDEAVLLDLSTSACYTLTPVATMFWTLCTGDLETQSILSTIGEQFDVTEDILRSDITALVSSLSQEGLIVERTP